MIAHTSVACSGVVYSSLMSDQFNYCEMQEGFLLGSAVEHTSTQISDAEINHQTTTNTIHITSYHSLELLGCLYDCKWTVRDQTIENVVKMANENNQKVLGWYVKRCYTDSWDTVYLRERLIHQQLREKLNCPDFVFIIINSRNSQADCTTNYIVNIWRDNKLNRFPLKINNLGNTSSTEYKLDPPNPGLYRSPALVNKVQKQKKIEEAVSEAICLHEQLENSMESQLLTLAHIEHVRNVRLQQILALRSTCYLNNIVPEYELSNSRNQEKPEEDGDQPIANGIEEKSEEKNEKEKTILKETPRVKRLRSPVPMMNSVIRNKSPSTNKPNEENVDKLDTDMNNLSVTGTTVTHKVPLNKGDGLRPPSSNKKSNAVKSTSSSPAGRSPLNADISTPRKYGSVTNMPRQSRSPSVRSAKRKLINNTTTNALNSPIAIPSEAKMWK